MAELHTITVNLDEIRSRAEAVSEIRLNRTTTPEDELQATLYTLTRAIDECRLAEYAVKVEQQQAEEALVEAGYEPGDDSALARQLTLFRQYAERFTRRMAAIDRALEDRRESAPPP
jgi:prefoldin subunit 5